MDKYVICGPYEMNNYFKKGYRFVCAFSEHYVSSGTTVSSNSLSGTLGNDPINIHLNLPVPTQNSNTTTKIIMELNETAEVLFRDNK